jgi:integrase
LIYYNKFPHDKPLDQGLINKFIVAHKNNNVVRAFISMLLNFLNRSDIKIQKKTGRKKQRIMQPLTMSEINTLAKACYDHSKKIGLMFELLFHLALRREEITTMQVTWFNWDQWIEDRSKPCRIGIIGKNNKQRHLLLSAFVTPLEEIQRRLGHQSIQTTMIYLHVDEEAMLKSWEKEFI